ncbi:hypothetical protein [Flavobacterium sp. Arc2]|jgi:hypothetical protein|uniref:hypothetical protein n=1 Tax=Flavobacterium sp. Arc2 TaxID=3046685 RepID=UPI00352EF42E
MDQDNSADKVLEGVKSFISKMPSVPNGTYVIQNSTIEGYGTGQAAFDKLKDEFNELDLSKAIKSSDLDKKIKTQEEQLSEIEKKYATLTSVFGKNGEANQGSLAHTLLVSLEKEISNSISKRDELLQDVITADIDSKVKIAELQIKIKEASKSSNDEIRAAKVNATSKVRIIEQFSDFLAETNSNMKLYFWVILFLVSGAVVTIALSVPDLLQCFKSYDTFITSLGATATSWQILNFAFGLLIVKLPWALCLSAVFTGMYSLLKGLLNTYEKINQDKRNMSAIYAVSGNIAEALNEYGLSIAEADVEDEETGELYTIIRAPYKKIKQKRESLKWNQIINYFERMQHHKNDVEVPEDPSKLKLVTGLLNKVIEKIPKA